MRSTYLDAAAVLVLDTELEDLDITNRPSLEVCAYAFTASWNWRLWTFQEGALPKELWFQFKGRAINALCFYLVLKNYLRKDDMRNRIAATGALARYLEIRGISGRHRPIDPKTQTFQTISCASQRTVTNSKDEAYCIATLLSLDPTTVVQQETSNFRMTALWQLLSNAGLIPRRIAFHFGKKLQIPGWRWALSTCLQSGADLAFLGSSLSPAFIVAGGLLIQGSGLILARPSGTRIKTSEAESEDSYVRSSHGSWSRVTPADTPVSYHIYICFASNAPVHAG